MDGGWMDAHSQSFFHMTTGYPFKHAFTDHGVYIYSSSVCLEVVFMVMPRNNEFHK